LAAEGVGLAAGDGHRDGGRAGVAERRAAVGAVGERRLGGPGDGVAGHPRSTVTVARVSTLDGDNGAGCSTGTLDKAGEGNCEGTTGLRGMAISKSGTLESTGGVLTVDGSTTFRNTGTLQANAGELDLTLAPLISAIGVSIFLSNFMQGAQGARNKPVRSIIDEYPGDLRVAVVGSGGLWHTPGAKDAYLDEAFDRAQLRYMEAGDICGMAQHFDGYQIPAGDTSQAVRERGRQATGMPGFGGPQGGTREICNWIAAAAVADGKPGTVVDYVPVYASPIGAGFAYWPEV